MNLKKIDQSIRNWNHKRIDYLRQLKIKFVFFLFSSFNKVKKEDAKSNFLILRTDDKLGDSVTSTGFLYELKKAYPQAKIHVVAGGSATDLYRKLTFIDEVYSFKRGFFYLFLLFNRLRNINFDYIINTSHILNPQVIVLVCLLKSYKKIGFENNEFSIFTDLLKIDFKKEHITDRYKNLLKLLSIQHGDLKYRLALDMNSVKSVIEMTSAIRQNFKRILVLNSFAGGRLRNLNQETTFQLVKKLTEDGDVAVISLANQGDQAILETWNLSDQKNWFHFKEFSSLDQNIALATIADLIITPDTSWVHIASALGKKLVAIYREDNNIEELNSIIWAPYLTNFKIVTAPSTSLNPDDINNVNVDEVVKAVQKLITS